MLVDFLHSIHYHSLISAIQDTTTKDNTKDYYYHSGSVDLVPIRNLHLFSQKPRAYNNSRSVASESGILKTNIG